MRMVRRVKIFSSSRETLMILKRNTRSYGLLCRRVFLCFSENKENWTSGEKYAILVLLRVRAPVGFFLCNGETGVKAGLFYFYQ